MNANQLSSAGVSHHHTHMTSSMVVRSPPPPPVPQSAPPDDDEPDEAVPQAPARTNRTSGSTLHRTLSGSAKHGDHKLSTATPTAPIRAGTPSSSPMRAAHQPQFVTVHTHS